MSLTSSIRVNVEEEGKRWKEIYTYVLPNPRTVNTRTSQPREVEKIFFIKKFELLNVNRTLVGF